MRTAAPRLAAGLITTVLLLGGCGSNPEPDPLPESAASPSPSASATPSAPVMPAAARKKTKAGAIAAVHHFLAAMEFAGNTGQVAAFGDTYTKECTRCQAIADGISETYEKGGSVEGGAWRPGRMEAYGISDDVAYVDASVTYEAQTWIKTSAGPTSTSQVRRNVLKSFQLRWLDGHWEVGALDPEL